MSMTDEEAGKGIMKKINIMHNSRDGAHRPVAVFIRLIFPERQ